MRKEKEGICPYHGKTMFVQRHDGYFACKKCASENVISKRRRLKEKLVEYKGGKCEICGYNKCIDALEFHHKDPNEKDFSISGKSVSLERLKKEVDKCILVCANCHREIHSEERLKQDAKIEKRIVHRKLAKEKKKKIDKNAVLYMIENGNTQAEIAKKENVSVSTLKRFLSENGIKMYKKK